MNAKTTIRKILFVAVWLCIGTGMLTLLLAAIRNRNNGACKDYTITIKGVQNNFFIDEKDVEKLLVEAMKGNIKGQPVSSFELHTLEQMLEHNTWVDEAELYFDNRDVLHVTISEKEPVARIFTNGNSSFYIDSSGRKMPLSDKMSARVPVFTGFPEKKKWNAVDSSLLNGVRKIANHIMADPFWMAQIAQVDISPERKFEMIPVVGDHMIRFGDADNIEKKFNRLFVFYKQVLAKTGFNHYKIIDVQYRGQVVASRYAGDPKVDSIQLKKNVEKLLRQSIEAESDTIIRALPTLTMLDVDSSNAIDPALQATELNPEKSSNPNPLKSDLPKPVPVTSKSVSTENKPVIAKPKQTVTSTKTVKKTEPVKPKAKLAEKPKEETKKTPKAVMPAKPKVETEYGGYN